MKFASSIPNTTTTTKKKSQRRLGEVGKRQLMLPESPTSYLSSSPSHFYPTFRHSSLCLTNKQILNQQVRFQLLPYLTLAEAPGSFSSFQGPAQSLGCCDRASLLVPCLLPFLLLTVTCRLTGLSLLLSGSRSPATVCTPERSSPLYPRPGVPPSPSPHLCEASFSPTPTSGPQWSHIAQEGKCRHRTGIPRPFHKARREIPLLNAKQCFSSQEMFCIWETSVLIHYNV